MDGNGVKQRKTSITTKKAQNYLRKKNYLQHTLPDVKFDAFICLKSGGKIDKDFFFDFHTEQH